MAKSDGSEDFYQAATFTAVEGLTDPLWTSFVSYKHPGMFLKHDGSFLRLGEVSTEIEMKEATFSVGW